MTHERRTVCSFSYCSSGVVGLDSSAARARREIVIDRSVAKKRFIGWLFTELNTCMSWKRLLTLRELLLKSLVVSVVAVD